MIYILFLLDIILYNFTSYTTYFFIIYLYNKPYKYYLLCGLILDLVIFETMYLNIIILTIIYLLNKLFNDLNKHHFYNYVFINLFNYLAFIILSNIIFANFSIIFYKIGINLFVNLLFYILSYRVFKFQLEG